MADKDNYQEIIDLIAHLAKERDRLTSERRYGRRAGRAFRRNSTPPERTHHGFDLGR